VAQIPEAPRPGLDPSGEALAITADALAGEVGDALDRFAPDDALRAIWNLVSAANRHLAGTTPWALAKDPSQVEKVRTTLFHSVAALRAVGAALGPFLPDTARAIDAALADPARPAPHLFPRRDRASVTSATEA
jgi:methionyl-tRNA synthetase